MLGWSKAEYTRRYSFKIYPPYPREVKTNEVEVVDPRVKISVETKDLLKSFYLSPITNVTFSVPMSYNAEKGVYDLIEQPNKVEADTKFYFYPSEPAPEADAGLYYPRVDEYYRVITHIAVVDQIVGTLTTDANNYLETHVMLIEKQVKREYISGSTTALSASSSWDTGSVDATYYSQIRGFVYADQDGTLNYYVSYDGTNWHKISTKTYTGGDEVGFEYDVLAKYVKVEFVNGSTDQTSFEIRVYGKI